MKLCPACCSGVLFAVLAAPAALAFDSTAVLPKGVRRIYLRSVHTEFSERTTSTGNSQSLASPLAKDVTFNDFLAVRSGAELVELESYLLSKNIDANQSVGHIAADLKADINAYVPTVAYGLTDRFNIGIAVPIYQAATDVKLAFTPNQRARDFVAGLAEPETGQAAKAQEAAAALNDVIPTLNRKLADNGYDELGRWDAVGLGDPFVKMKYLNMENGLVALATHGGVSAPLGRTDDPDNLTDIGFGDGSWDVFLGQNFDLNFWDPLFLNLNAQYTWQAPAKRELRLKTKEEPIAAEKKEVGYDLGDRIDMEASVQADSRAGLLAGLGYAYAKKFADDYSGGDAGTETAELYEDGTEQEGHVAEALLGYSSVRPYRAGRAAVPFEISTTYQRQLQSWNLPKADRAILDLKVFF